MQHMVFIMVLWIGLFGACKSDSTPSDSSPNENSDIRDTSELNNNVSDTLSIGVNASDKPKSVPTPEPEVQHGEVTSVPVDKDRTKSVPKPEPVETKDIIEQVPTGTKPKSVPKPEPEAMKGDVEEVSVEVNNIDHSSWDALLSKYVNASGKVNYKGLKSDIEVLNSYLEMLKNVDVGNLKRNEKLAFWINAYNAFTVKKIVDNYPISSITKLDGGKPWDVKWIKLDGRTLSLNNIENDIIRPEFNEPRIHFAVNCAAKSCPPLLNKAWTGSNLEKYLEIQAAAFINSSRYNDIKSNQINVSKIFEWYGGDFGGLIDYLNKYSKTTIKPNASISYKEYDWALNE